MELLAQPYARDFFGDHAGQFLTEHRYDFIKEMCAFCSIHTFETWLYEHPDASLAQWAEEFDRIEKSFGRAQNNEPWRQQVLAGCDLFTNMALYMFPRYVISYALSIVCAQQLKAAYDADPADGWARYHALCASGGTPRPFRMPDCPCPMPPAWWRAWPRTWPASSGAEKNGPQLTVAELPAPLGGQLRPFSVC